jgi:Flp pilus assembly protein TadD
MYLGLARSRQENYAGAEMAISKAVELSPNDARTWVGLGLIRDLQENYIGAEEAYTKVLELDPKHKTVWKNLGDARFNQENYIGAEEAYTKAMGLDPKNKAAWKNLGGARFNQENYAEAEEAFYKLLKLDPTDIVTYSSLSEIMIRNSRIPDLLNLLNKALSLKKTGKHFKAFVRLLRAMAFLFQQDMTPFRKQLAEGTKMMTTIKQEQMHSIVGELSDLMVEIMGSDNLRTIRTYINEIEKISADIAALINPINHVLDYFEELFSDQKGKKAAADRAQRVLDSITSEIRGPVEEMIQQVAKNISKV